MLLPQDCPFLSVVRSAAMGFIVRHQAKSGEGQYFGTRPNLHFDAFRYLMAVCTVNRCWLQSGVVLADLE